MELATVLFCVLVRFASRSSFPFSLCGRLFLCSIVDGLFGRRLLEQKQCGTGNTWASSYGGHWSSLSLASQQNIVLGAQVWARLPVLGSWLPSGNPCWSDGRGMSLTSACV